MLKILSFFGNTSASTDRTAGLIGERASITPDALRRKKDSFHRTRKTVVRRKQLLARRSGN